MEIQKYIKTIAVIIFIVLAGFAIAKLMLPSTVQTVQAQQTTGTQTGTGDAQEITLGFGTRNYNPETITVNVGEPVRITGDLNTLFGCFRSFRIPELGVQGSFSGQNTDIEFTPTKKGSFTFSCPMGMGSGLLIVQ